MRIGGASALIMISHLRESVKEEPWSIGNVRSGIFRFAPAFRELSENERLLRICEGNNHGEFQTRTGRDEARIFHGGFLRDGRRRRVCDGYGAPEIQIGREVRSGKEGVTYMVRRRDRAAEAKTRCVSVSGKMKHECSGGGAAKRRKIRQPD